jgi:hypothetical protein
MTIAVYQKGDLVRIATIFKNSAGTAIDPTGVKFAYTPPSGETVEFVYPTDPELVKDSTGNYHVDLDTAEAGPWYYRWIGTGTGQAAENGQFFVEPSYFTVTP